MSTSMGALDAAAIEALITSFITREVLGQPDAAIDRDDNLFTSGHLDSVGIMRLIAYLETTLGRTIPPADLVAQNFRTIAVMAAYLARSTGPGEALPDRGRG